MGCSRKISLNPSNNTNSISSRRPAWTTKRKSYDAWLKVARFQSLTWTISIETKKRRSLRFLWKHNRKKQEWMMTLKKTLQLWEMEKDLVGKQLQCKSLERMFRTLKV